jgi:hypothetical protein
LRKTTRSLKENLMLVSYSGEVSGDSMYDCPLMKFSFREHPVPVEDLGMRAEPFA